MIRFICEHPYLYTALTAVPYVAATLAPTEAMLGIMAAWTAARILIAIPARRRQAQNSEQRGSVSALRRIHDRLTETS